MKPTTAAAGAKTKAACSTCERVVETYEDSDGFEHFSTHDRRPGERCPGSGKPVEPLHKPFA